MKISLQLSEKTQIVLFNNPHAIYTFGKGRGLCWSLY